MSASTAPDNPDAVVEWLTVRQFLAEFQVSMATYYDAVHNGRLIVHRFGRTVRIRRAAVEAWAAAAAVTGPGAVQAGRYHRGGAAAR